MGLRIEDIRKPKANKRKGKRKGRGIGSGRGKTSGRGHKGAKSRSGGGTYNPGFEGGQMPLVRRVPKRGFTNKFAKEWVVVNIGTFQKADLITEGTVVDRNFLLTNRIIKTKRLPIKVLGKGKLTKKLTVKACAFSESAKKAIEAADGKIEIVAYKDMFSEGKPVV
ncbi:MAG: 50S ribosomal protein L15 [Candidatus Omnitrophota bacterium]